MFHAALLDVPKRLSVDTDKLEIFDVQNKKFQTLVFLELLSTTPLIILSLTRQLLIDIVRPCHALFLRRVSRHTNLIYKLRCFIKLSIDIIYALSLFGFCKKYIHCLAFGFSDHGCYSYAGSIEAILVSLSKPFYSTGYPYTLSLIRPGISNKVCDFRQIVISSSVDEILNRQKSQSSFSIPYLIATNSNIQSLGDTIVGKIPLASFVLYAHSFSDAQNYHGYDNAFQNIEDWTHWTLSNLLQSDQLVIYKAHPNFWANFDSDVIKYDKKIFKRTINKFSGHPNLIIINQPISNDDLMPHLSNNVKCVTHHGSVASETLSHSLSTIAASIHPLDSYFTKSKNYFSWSSKSDYKSILQYHYRSQKSIQEHFPNILDEFYRYHPAYGSDNSSTKLISDYFGLHYSEFISHPSRSIAQCYNSLSLEKRKKLYNKIAQTIVENPNNILT